MTRFLQMYSAHVVVQMALVGKLFLALRADVRSTGGAAAFGGRKGTRAAATCLLRSSASSASAACLVRPLASSTPPSPSSEEKGGAGGAGAAGEEVGSSTKFCNLNMKVGCLGEDITEKNGGYIYSGRRQ